MVIGGLPKQVDSVKRPLHQIEWRAENLSGDIFDGVFVSLRRSHFPETEIGFAALTNHLYRPAFARKKREAQNLLAFDHSLKSGLAGLPGDEPSQLNEAADMIRDIGDLDRRRLPQFPLRKSQRLEARLPARQPLLRRARLSADMGIRSSA